MSGKNRGTWHLKPVHSAFGPGFLLAMPIACAAAAFACGAASMLTKAMSPPASTVAKPKSVWLDIVKPVRIFSLQAPELTGLPASYSARRLETGTTREDSLAFGLPAPGTTALRLRISRTVEGAKPAALLTVLARFATEAELKLTESAPAKPMTTRFGNAELADVGLRAVDGRMTGCSGFRIVTAQPALEIAGLACGTKVTAALPCLVDRIDLASAGEDRALADFFAASELRRNRLCAGTRLAPVGAHAAWLDDTPATQPKSLHHLSENAARISPRELKL